MTDDAGRGSSSSNAAGWQHTFGPSRATTRPSHSIDRLLHGPSRLVRSAEAARSRWRRCGGRCCGGTEAAPAVLSRHWQVLCRADGAIRCLWRGWMDRRAHLADRRARQSSRRSLPRLRRWLARPHGAPWRPSRAHTAGRQHHVPVHGHRALGGAHGERERACCPLPVRCHCRAARR